jgi:cellulose synthase/poly-beta-1,6-N-acetylglucosamine synthase-like glycosyltransferase
MPTVSVIIPAYNAALYVGEALGSVFEQTFRDFEVIVIDDGSTDDTARVVQRASAGRARYLRQPNAGPSASRNRGVLESSSSLICFLDADDVWMKDKLTRQVECLQRNPQAGLVYTDYSRGRLQETSPGSRLKAYSHKGSGNVFYNLLRQNFIHTSSVMLRREVLPSAGLFDPNLRGTEDLELWLRIARNNAFAYLDESLVFVRQHEANTTSTVEFVREQVRAYRIMMARWGRDPSAATVLREVLGACYWDLAYAERTAGQLPAAVHAYLQSSFRGHRTFEALLRAAWTSGLAAGRRLLPKRRQSSGASSGESMSGPQPALGGGRMGGAN